MSTLFNLPDLGEGLPDAEIVQWHIQEGDVVKVDQLLVSMETAKAVVDVPSPQAGRITKLFGKAGDIIKTGAPLVEFTANEKTTTDTENLIPSNDLTSAKDGTSSENTRASTTPFEKTSKSCSTQTKEQSSKKSKLDKENNDKSTENTSKDKGTVVGAMEESDTILIESATGITVQQHTEISLKALPAVRVLAKQLSVQLNMVTATGSHGEITVDDVKRAAMIGQVISNHSSKVISENTLETKTEGLRGVRRAMANAMSQSHAEVVPVTLVDDADIHAWPKGTDITARVLRAIVHACRVEPALNAHFDKNNLEIKRFGEIHIGIAMDSKDGLFVPVIRNSEQCDAKTFRTYIDRFKKQVLDRTIPQDELKGSTIQLSNFGSFAGRYANPVIVPPIVAILGTGKIRDEVVAVHNAIAIHRVLPLSLTIDHRAVTGGEAARFLAALIRDLQETI